MLAAFGLLYAHTHSFEFAVWQARSSSLSPTLRGVIFVLLLVAFGSKIGTLPLQVPLPIAYAAAPGSAAAAISVALTAGFYGLWRLVFETIAPAELWFGELLLVLGGLGAVVGILYAIAEEDIRRFLGFSTIEHSGIVLIGFGVALIGQATHHRELAAAGLLAATLHVIAHGTAKTLAFLASIASSRASGERELGPLGGLARPLPQTAAGFGLAVATLAALPPFAGFVSEWFTFEALMQGFRLDSTFARLLMALAGALLALTAGLSLLAFAKLFGAIFLGRARSALTVLREPVDRPFGVACAGVRRARPRRRGAMGGPLARPGALRGARLRSGRYHDQPPARARARVSRVSRCSLRRGSLSSCRSTQSARRASSCSS